MEHREPTFGPEMMGIRPVVAAAVLGIAIVGALVLKVAAMAVPDDPVIEALESAVADGRIGPNYPGDLRGGMIDRFTECYGFGIGLADSKGRGDLVEALTDPALGSCERLSAWLAEPSPRPDAASHYYRYWHGYVIVTRPVLAVGGPLGVTAARTLGILTALIGIGAFGWAVGRATRGVVGVAAIAPLLVTTNVVVGSANTLHGLSTGWALGSAAVLLEVVRRRGGAQTVIVAALLSGAGFAFLDLLTVPPMAWMATVWAGLLGTAAREPGRGGPRIEMAAVAATGWLGGYAITWAAKWVATATVLDLSTVLSDITRTAGFRLGGDIDGGADYVGGAIIRNLSWWIGPVPKLLAGLAALLIAAGVAWRWRRTDVRRWLLLASPVAILPVWYELLHNHSQFHAWFTYRSLGFASGILLASWWLAQRAPTNPEGGEGRDRTGGDIGGGPDPLPR